MKKFYTVMSITLVLIVIATAGVTFAYYQIERIQQGDPNVISSKCFETTFSGSDNRFYLDNTLPIEDTVGEGLSPYSFTVTNTCDMPVEYFVYLEVQDESTGSLEDYVRIRIDKTVSGTYEKNIISAFNEVDEESFIYSDTEASFQIASGELLAQGNYETFNLRMWLDINTTKDQGAGKVLSTKIGIVTKPVKK